MDQRGLRHRRSEDPVREALPRVPVDEESGDRVQEGEQEPEQLRDVPDCGLAEGHRADDGADLEADHRLPHRYPPKALRQRRVREEAEAGRDPIGCDPPLPRRKRRIHTGVRTTIQSTKNAATRFPQWTWRVRFWPRMSNPFTMSASRGPIPGRRIRS